MDGELSVLTPASLPFRLPSTNWHELHSDLIFNHRGDHTRLQEMSVRQYLYPVHISLMFLFTQTLASALVRTFAAGLGRGRERVVQPRPTGQQIGAHAFFLRAHLRSASRMCASRQKMYALTMRRAHQNPNRTYCCSVSSTCNTPRSSSSRIAACPTRPSRAKRPSS